MQLEQKKKKTKKKDQRIYTGHEYYLFPRDWILVQVNYASLNLTLFLMRETKKKQVRSHHPDELMRLSPKTEAYKTQGLFCHTYKASFIEKCYTFNGL